MTADLVSSTWNGVSAELAAVGSTLKADPRLADCDVVVMENDVVEVRQKQNLVVITRADDLVDDPLAPYLERLAESRVGLLIVGTPDEGFLDRLPKRTIVNLFDRSPSADALLLLVRSLLERVDLRQRDERMGRWLNRYRYELGELIEIARALSQERDISRLLELILEKARLVTGADAGSIYVLEGADPDPTKNRLRFKTSQNDSCDFESSEFTMPVSSRSIAGYAVVTKKAISIPDVEDIPEDAPYGYDKSFDERVGYRTRSMYTTPLITAEEDVIGVIQLINKKVEPARVLSSEDDFDSQVVPFDERSEELLATLASQAGIALENALLYDEIKRIFEGFVIASVQAIEQRDPTTSGHSFRVSELSCRLAEVVDRTDSGPFAGATFTRRELKELEYAALLHDFGKIGVREQVLVKAKKLYPHELTAIRQRVHYSIKALEVQVLRERMALIERGASKDDLAAAERVAAERRGELELVWKLVMDSNEPTVMSEGEFGRIAQLAGLRYTDPYGHEHPLLTESEIQSLQITRGSLNDAEIDEIRSHVVHTFNFLSRIPWGKSFRNIPRIAGMHHEKLNGTGYPDGVTAEAIPLQSKIMTIADIYDALTARDRPYKKAIPVTRALDILGFEVEGGNIDAELVRIFREARVFEVVGRDSSVPPPP